MLYVLKIQFYSSVALYILPTAITECAEFLQTS